MNLNYVALLLKIQKASLCEEMKTIQVYVRKWKQYKFMWGNENNTSLGKEMKKCKSRWGNEKNACLVEEMILVCRLSLSDRPLIS